MTTQAEVLQALYARCIAAPPSGRALETARLGILDCIGCILAGASSDAARLVREMASEQGQPERGITVIGTGHRLATPLAALANGVAGHALDYDDMSHTLVGHPSVVLLPASLAVAEALGKSGADLLMAYVAGFEIEAHFARAMVPRHYDAGWHSTSSLGILGAAAAAASLLGLAPEAMLEALAIAASGSSGLRANFGSMTKALHAGTAAEGGVRSALLAERGFTANRAVFDVRGGYFDAYGRNAEAKPAPSDGALEIETAGIGIKPYACCGAGCAVVDAALDLRTEHALDPRRIESVELAMSPRAASIMPFHAVQDGAHAKYSAGYCAAVALVDGRAGLAQFEDARVRGDDVQRLLARTQVRIDPHLPFGGGRFGVEMTIALAGGRRVSTALEIPRGDRLRPLEPERLLDKFLECAAPVLGEPRAREVAVCLASLEHEAGVDRLARLLVPGAARG